MASHDPALRKPSINVFVDTVLEVSPDGERRISQVEEVERDFLVSACQKSKKIHWDDIHTGKAAKATVSRSAIIHALASTDHGEILVAGSNPDEICSYHFERDEPSIIFDFKDGDTPTCISVNSNSTSAILGTLKANIVILHHKEGEWKRKQELRSEHKGTINNIQWSDSGQRFVTASRDGSTKVWFILPKVQYRQILLHSGERTSVKAASFFHYNENLVLTSHASGTSIIWDSSTSKVVHILKGHKGSCNSHCISHDDGLIITASSDKTIRIWSPENGSLIRSVTCIERIDSVTIINDIIFVGMDNATTTSYDTFGVLQRKYSKHLPGTVVSLVHSVWRERTIHNDPETSHNRLSLSGNISRNSSPMIQRKNMRSVSPSPHHQQQPSSSSSSLLQHQSSSPSLSSSLNRPSLSHLIVPTPTPPRIIEPSDAINADSMSANTYDADSHQLPVIITSTTTTTTTAPIISANHVNPVVNNDVITQPVRVVPVLVSVEIQTENNDNSLELKSQLINLNETLASLKIEGASHRATISKLEKALTSKDLELESHKIDLSFLQDQNHILTADNDSKSETIHQLEQSQIDLLEQLNKLIKQSEIREATLASLKDEIRQSRSNLNASQGKTIEPVAVNEQQIERELQGETEETDEQDGYNSPPVNYNSNSEVAADHDDDAKSTASAESSY